MRAFAIRSFGEAPAIHDLPIPAADGGFLIHVRYAGVNPIDYKLVDRLTTTSASRSSWVSTSRVWSNAFRREILISISVPAIASSAWHERTAPTPSTPRSHGQ
jgi:hypothetical protein